MTPGRYLPRMAKRRLHRDLRLPDERGRLRADVRPARARGLRAHRAAGRGRRHAGQHLRGPGQRRAAGDRAGGRAAAATSAPAACSAWWAAWRSGWALGCWSRCHGWIWWSGPTRTAISAELIGIARVGTAGDRHRVPLLGALRGRARRCGKRVRRLSSRYSGAATTVAPSVSSRTPGGPSEAGGWPTWCGKWSRWRSRAPAKSRCWARRSIRTTTASTTSPTCCGPSAR